DHRLGGQADGAHLMATAPPKLRDGVGRFPVGKAVEDQQAGRGAHQAPTGSAARICAASRAKPGMSRLWAPSLMAWSGSGCTSMIAPWAPAARPARVSAGTMLRTPAAWLGSASTGRW